MKFVLVGLAALGLTACAEKQFNEMSYTELKTIAMKIAAKCKAQGVTTRAEFEVCYRQEALVEDTRRRNSVASSQAAAGAVGSALGLALALGSQPR